jgi:cellulose synthase/poly-beta-1,6-N-acetylglucosamine synthase-like glycosyltransferase
MPLAYGLLIGSAVLAAYIVLGYPLLLTRLKWNTAPAIRKDMGFQPTVSVIMAVHNGAADLGAKLEVLTAFDYPRDRVQIIVVSDGSTDETESIVERFEAAPVTLLKVPRGGKAAALNHALTVASGEILFLTDVRQPLDPLALSHLAANFADPTVGAATGELKLLPGEDGEHRDMDLYWRYEVLARKRHSDIDSLFTTTGCIYAMRRELAEPIPPDTLSDDAMMALRAFFRGYRVIFDPAAVAYDYPAVAGTEFRRRFRTLAGLWQLHARLPQIFTRRNRMRFHFLSHKFSRLVLPWALLLFAAASIALPASRFKILLLTLELAFVFLAVANRFVPKGFPLKRLSSPAQTFLVMNVAAVMAVAVFFVPATRLWKPTRVASR